MNYFCSLIKVLFSPRNWRFVLYMVVNAFPICWLIAQIYSRRSLALFLTLFLLVFAFYFFGSVIVGSFLARSMLKAHTQIHPEDGGVLGATFSQAYVAAKRMNPLISDNIRLYVYDSMEMDGYAFGRNTLCLSSAAIGLPEEALRVLLLLKFAQFSHHDSEMLTFMTAGNLWYIILSVIFKGSIYALGIVIRCAMEAFEKSFIGSTIFNVLKAWAEITEKGLLLVMRGFLNLGLLSYRNNIFENDCFVCDCGYRSDLIYFLRNYEPEQFHQETLLGVVDAMKPSKQLRLLRLENNGDTPTGGFRIIRR